MYFEWKEVNTKLFTVRMPLGKIKLPSGKGTPSDSEWSFFWEMNFSRVNTWKY